MTSHRRLVAVAGIMVASVSSAAYAQSPNRNDSVPARPDQTLTAIERSFAVLPTAEPLTMFPQIREALRDTPAFFRDSKADINFRSYYRDELTNVGSGGPATWKESLGGRRFGGVRERQAIRPDLRRLCAVHVLSGLCATRP